jgi:hypothetical protein
MEHKYNPIRGDIDRRPTVTKLATLALTRMRYAAGMGSKLLTLAMNKDMVVYCTRSHFTNQSL